MKDLVLSKPENVTAAVRVAEFGSKLFDADEDKVICRLLLVTL